MLFFRFVFFSGSDINRVGLAVIGHFFGLFLTFLETFLKALDTAA